MKEFVTIGYSYDELNETAKENVKRWYLDDPVRAELFKEDIDLFLSETFPKSKLEVQFSLSNCQGDGLNIYGTVNFFDFLDKWNANDDDKQTMKAYIETTELYEYVFTQNNRYGYSFKFIDKKDIDYMLIEMIDKLDDKYIVKTSHLIKQFFIDMFDYFENLDHKLEQDGYEYLYNCEDDEVEEFCETNNYYFDINGKFIG